LFNILEARGVLSVTERVAYISKVRDLSKSCCSEFAKRYAAKN
jgi:glycyl-tRNA synthetase alpha chain